MRIYQELFLFSKIYFIKGCALSEAFNKILINLEKRI